MATYGLVNMCISIPHPLNTQNGRVVELLQGPALAKLHELQKGVDDESDEEDEEEEDEEAEVESAVDTGTQAKEIGSDATAPSTLEGHETAQPALEATKKDVSSEELETAAL